MTAKVETATTEESLRDQKLASLWALTPDNLKGKLPKPYKRDAQKGNCNECGGYHGLPAMHLDYLGHADTCRLIAEVDPHWQWEPIGGWTATGEPVFVRSSGGYPIALWIWLDILGERRPGVGTVGNGKSDPEKELIGDAIRNAAMRFGVGADLWSKATHADDDDTGRTYNQGQVTDAPGPKTEGWDDAATEAEAHRSLAERIKVLSDRQKASLKEHSDKYGWPMGHDAFLAMVREVEACEAEQAALKADPLAKDEGVPMVECVFCRQPLKAAEAVTGQMDGLYHRACGDEEAELRP